MSDTLGHRVNGQTAKTFRLIRHGSTSLNEPGDGDRIRAWRDLPIDAKGQREVDELADRLKNSGLQVIFSSDLKRAVATAKALGRTTGARIIHTPKLRPWDLGEYAGKRSSDVIAELGQFVDAPDRKVPGGESFNSFRARAFEGLKQAIGRAGDENLGIVTHHRVERLLKGWIAAGQPDDHDVAKNVFLQRGEAPGHAEKLTIKPWRL